MQFADEALNTCVDRRLVPDFHRQVLAVNRVERLLLKLTAADKAGSLRHHRRQRCGRLGGDGDGAVATKDVDVLLRRADLIPGQGIGGRFARLHEVLGYPCSSWRNPNPKTGVHVIFAGEKVRERDAHPFPDVTASQRSRAGFLVLDLPMLVRMKLVAFRRVDQVHIEDLIAVGLIDDAVVRSLPDDLLPRLEEIRTTE